MFLVSFEMRYWTLSAMLLLLAPNRIAVVSGLASSPPSSIFVIE